MSRIIIFFYSIDDTAAQYMKLFKTTCHWRVTYVCHTSHVSLFSFPSLIKIATNWMGIVIVRGGYWLINRCFLSNSRGCCHVSASYMVWNKHNNETIREVDVWFDRGIMSCSWVCDVTRRFTWLTHIGRIKHWLNENSTDSLKTNANS